MVILSGNIYDEEDAKIGLALLAHVENQICEIITKEVNSAARYYEQEYDHNGDVESSNVKDIFESVGFSDLPMGEWYFENMIKYDMSDYLCQMVWDKADYKADIMCDLNVNYEKKQIEITFKER